jgi:hypothetical protein
MRERPAADPRGDAHARVGDRDRDVHDLVVVERADVHRLGDRASETLDDRPDLCVDVVLVRDQDREPLHRRAEVEARRLVARRQALHPPFAGEHLGEPVDSRPVEPGHLGELCRRHPMLARGELTQDSKPLLEAAELAHATCSAARARTGSRRRAMALSVF